MRAHTHTYKQTMCLTASQLVQPTEQCVKSVHSVYAHAFKNMTKIHNVWYKDKNPDFCKACSFQTHSVFISLIRGSESDLFRKRSPFVGA